MPPPWRRDRGRRARAWRSRLSFERLQRDELGVHTPLGDSQPGQRDRQLEAPRTGAARVQIEHAVLLVEARLMAVAADHGGEAGRARLQVELVQVVQQI